MVLTTIAYHCTELPTVGLRQSFKMLRKCVISRSSLLPISSGGRCQQVFRIFQYI